MPVSPASKPSRPGPKAMPGPGQHRSQASATPPRGGNWQASLAEILKAHNRAKVDGSKASAATQDKRGKVLYAGFKLLRQEGYKLDSVRQFRGKHMAALVKLWEARKLSPSVLQNNISIFRTFAGWIGKAGMVEAAENYVSTPGAASRSSINREDKSWEAQAVDVAAKLEEVAAKDARAGLQLALQATFGLRAREAMQLRPHIAHKATEADGRGYLALNVGTKGGRDRVVPVDTAEKVRLLEQAKTFAASKLASTSDPNRTLLQWKNHYYHVLKTCGITRKDGITSHGLRHAYANNRYAQLTGEASPVRGGGDVDRETDRAARLEVAEELGHSRESVTTHYLGR
jgi:integrase